MQPTNTLHRRFGAEFQPADGRSRTELPFLLDAWPLLPIWGPGPIPAPVRNPLAVEAGQAFHDLGRQGLARMFRTWQKRIRYRRELNRLMQVAPHMIDDIGLTLDQALSEADRPFWC